MKNMNNYLKPGHSQLITAKEHNNEIVHILDHMHIILFSFEASMGKIKDDPIKPVVLQVLVKPHFFHVNTMQNCGAQSFQLQYI